jgi:hypothetical protein
LHHTINRTFAFAALPSVIGGPGGDFMSLALLIPEIDIWRAAQLMIKRYGDNALEETAARANELALAGDDAGAATWRRIMAAVTQLANNAPPGRVR